MIFLKILAFLGVLIGIGVILMIIFSGNTAILSVISLVTISIGALAITDLAVFFIVLLYGSDNLKKNWKSLFSLMIASAAALATGLLFKIFMSDVPLMAKLSYGLSIVLFLAVIVNLVCNIFYILFGTGKLTVPWKLFIFFMILTGISGIVCLFSTSLNEVIPNSSAIITPLSLIVACGSFLAAIASLLTVIVNGIYSKGAFNSFFKLFLSLIIISAVLSFVSGIFHFIYAPLRNILMYAAILALFVGVGVFIVIVFRSIFLNKPFCKSENSQNKKGERGVETNGSASISNVVSNSAANNMSVTDSTNNSVGNISGNGFDITDGQ